ncbi:MAG: asparagine--tRNA ligase [Elusimicrobiaceae bacterium]|nr:asparagine--tRNA ligase [Elusimicrobiaceae bacterium]MBT3955383.1 asparagine--tRNA ligase [Elusimicrobiaceae bacterium]MBT4007660.1 asparagine--tRNA ligase [Elusimicrobiaceae bacterium]MBT4402330.1 asparagine--tRNA ligase [Elusimicrobiaceae bacterium]MBT4439563.1 asparagine--tRNA ligase [Elusimicrobiaceae bacterium]
MKNKVYIKDIAKYAGKTITIMGWLANKRSSGKLHFLQVRDGSGIIQCVMFKGDVSEEAFETADKLSQETSIVVIGEVKEDKRSTLGYEIGIKELKIVGESKDYPISNKDHGVAFLMDNRHLWLRSSRQVAILKIRDEIIFAIREFFRKEGFISMDAPIFTPNACEGTSNLFETNYFDSKAYLTQSGQLYGEAGAMALGKVYVFGPTFRAEKSKTRRHLTEFWMVEPEMAYHDLEMDMEVAENFISYVVQQVVKNRKEELKILERDISKLEAIVPPFPRITYTEAIEILKKKGNPTKWGEDLGADEETIISNEFDKPVIIHRYPAAIKSFYMKRDANDDKLALGMDIIGPEGAGEIVGGSERETDYDKLVERIKEHKLSMEAFEWYLDLRKYGTVPHAGFGLGLERTVGWICGLPHVRETIPFPRLMDRIKP